MVSILVFALILIISYFVGSFSGARFVAKTFRHLKICKVGTGRPDTENIFLNVSKSLGVLVGAIDFLKVYIFLVLLEHLLPKFQITDKYSTASYLFFISVMILVGHIFPVLHKFFGGRGIFTYIAIMTYFAYYPMLITAVFVILIMMFFKQFRFSQYMIVILPPLINFFFKGDKSLDVRLLLLAFLMGIFNFISSKQRGEL